MQSRDMRKKILIAGYAIVLVLIIISLINIFRTEKISISCDVSDLEYNDEDSSLVSKWLAVPKGVYEVIVEYKSESNESVEVEFKQDTHNSGYADTVILPKEESQKIFTFWANEPQTMLRFHFMNKDSEVSIESISVQTAQNSGLHSFAKLLLLVIGILITLYFILYYERIKTHTLAIIGITVITACSSLILFTRYLLPGTDLNFHLARIEVFANSLFTTILPVRVQTEWNYGWGYPASLLFGNIMILFPSFIRFCGFTVQTAYKTYVLLLNLATSVTAFLCFMKYTKGKVPLALAFSFFYTCSPYRLFLLYTRGALSEIAFSVFLPVLFIGLYDIYFSGDESNRHRALIFSVIGLTGAFQSDVKSFKMILAIIILFALLQWNTTFRKETLLLIFQITGLFILLNAWALIPYRSFSKVVSYAKEERIYNADFQLSGIGFPSVFMNLFSGSMNENAVMPPGIGLLLLNVQILLLALKGKKKAKLSTVYIPALFGALLLFAASDLFPYSFLKNYFPGLFHRIASVRFPYQYLIPATMFFCISGSVYGKNFIKSSSKRIQKAVFILLVLISAGQSFNAIYGLLYHAEPKTIYAGQVLDTSDTLDGDLMYSYIGKDYIRQEHSITASDNVQIQETIRENNRFTIQLAAHGEEASIECPVIYYPGYIAYDENNQKLKTERSNELCRIKVSLPEDYTGTITVRYKESFVFLICDLISFLTAIGFSYQLICEKRGIHSVFHRLSDLMNRIADRIVLCLKGQDNAICEHGLITDDSKANLPGWIAFGVVSVIMFVIMLILNRYTGLDADDVHYTAFYDTIYNATEHSRRFQACDLFASMYNHRMLWNGRIVAHGLLQLALILPLNVFQIINAIVYLLLGYLILLHITYGRRKSLSILSSIYALMWFFLPQYGLTVLWASGAANYLWCACIILSVLLPFRMYLDGRNWLKDTPVCVILSWCLGFLGGCTNENTGGAMVLLSLMYLALFIRKHKRVPIWSISCSMGGIFGAWYLISAPSNRRVDSHTDIAGYLDRVRQIFNITENLLGALFLIIVILLALNVIFVKHKNEEKHAVLWAMYFISGLASIAALVLSAQYPERAWFVGTCLLICVAAYLYYELDVLLPKICGVVLALLFIGLILPSFRKELPEIQNTYAQIAEGERIINAALERGDESVEVPMIHASDSKYDSKKGRNYIQESEDDWSNSWFSFYYGIRIKGIPYKEE